MCECEKFNWIDASIRCLVCKICSILVCFNFRSNGLMWRMHIYAQYARVRVCGILFGVYSVIWCGSGEVGSFMVGCCVW